jgi:hypothetical protein
MLLRGEAITGHTGELKMHYIHQFTFTESGDIKLIWKGSHGRIWRAGFNPSGKVRPGKHIP